MTEIYLGLMSGTSVDCVDAVAVDFSSEKMTLLGSHTESIPQVLKNEILKLVKMDDIKSIDLTKIDTEIAELFVLAIKNLLTKTSLSSSQIKAIGSHGQTIKHLPSNKKPFSLQIGNPQVIKNLTTITTISDFRSADILAGGEGAPLAPLFHKAIFGNNKDKNVIINIGGIANITFLNFDNKEVFGYDIGPGNCLMDAWIRITKNLDFDSEGTWAKEGQLIRELLDLMLEDEFIKRKVPKSTGPDYFNINWIEEKLNALNINPDNKDVQATLLELTSESICFELRKYLQSIHKIFICGGGIHNKFLIRNIEKKINKKVSSSSNFGIHPDFVEAICFAWLARERMKKHSFDLSEITGSKGKVLLGKIW